MKRIAATLAAVLLLTGQAAAQTTTPAQPTYEDLQAQVAAYAAYGTPQEVGDQLAAYERLRTTVVCRHTPGTFNRCLTLEEALGAWGFGDGNAQAQLTRVRVELKRTRREYRAYRSWAIRLVHRLRVS